MPAGKQRIPRNMARIEFLACRELIASLLSQGFDTKKIHTRLPESGQVTMSYDAFCKVLLKASKNELHIQSLAPHPAPAPAPVAHKPVVQPPSPGSRIIKAGGRDFPDPRDMDPNASL